MQKLGKALHTRNRLPKKAWHMDRMESYWKRSASFSARVSCGIIRGSNEGTHDSQQTRDKHPWEKFSCN